MLRVTSDNKFKTLIVIGDKVLIKLSKPHDKTSSGLYLPASVQAKEKVQQGYVIKVGPGYAVASAGEEESWKPQDNTVKYVPLQVQEGDLAIFLMNEAIEIKYENETYYIVAQNSILMIERQDEDF